MKVGPDKKEVTIIDMVLKTLDGYQAIFEKDFLSFGKKMGFFYSYNKALFRYALLLFLKIDFPNRNIKVLGYRIFFEDYSNFFFMFREIFVHDVYYFSSQKDAPVIVDCGGNIGVSILYFKFIYPKSKIKVFEPLPRNVELMRKNIAYNKLVDIEVINKAVSDYVGEVKIYFNLEHTPSTSSVKDKDDDYNDEIVVPTVLVSDFITERVDMLKVDIELAEGRLFKDLDEKNKFDLIDRITFEYHYINRDKKNRLSDILNILDLEGYTVIPRQMELLKDFYRKDKYMIMFIAYK